MQTTTGATPLYIACQEGHQAVAGLLLDRGADVNQAKVRCGGGEGACGVLDGMWVVMRAGMPVMVCDACEGRAGCVELVWLLGVCEAVGMFWAALGVSCVWGASRCRFGVW